MKKKIVLLIVSLLTIASASATKVEKIQFANRGDFSLGVMAGKPRYTMNLTMPYISVDARWGLADGFCHTQTFGDNGAIDLGAYVAFRHHEDSWEVSSWMLPIAARGGFNWEFVKNLDVFVGLNVGCEIYHAEIDYMDNYYEDKTNIFTKRDPIFGMYGGAKWMFTKLIGVKAQYSTDWLRMRSHPTVSAGLQLNF